MQGVCRTPNSVKELSNSLEYTKTPRTHLISLKQVAANFRKTATNFHYEFNIRHLSNVFQGLLVAQPDQFKTAEKFVHLWMHESERVYGDRLVRLKTIYHLVQEYTSKTQNDTPIFFPRQGDSKSK